MTSVKLEQSFSLQTCPGLSRSAWPLKCFHPFFIISISALAQASTEPFTVMVLSGLYMLKSCKLATRKKREISFFKRKNKSWQIKHKSGWRRRGEDWVSLPHTVYRIPVALSPTFVVTQIIPAVKNVWPVTTYVFVLIVLEIIISLMITFPF